MDVGTLRFLESRIEEVHELNRRINAARPQLTFQRLPRHMKRRVMGHTSKRIPRSILEQHLNQQAKSGRPKKSKAPSRRHRRRPANARVEFERRENLHRWMETHLWHAKRFHMTERWGWKVALHPNDRSWRACWRAASAHCLLMDVSYLTCVQLQGPEHYLLKILHSLSSEDCEGNLMDSEVVTGTKEGRLVLFRRGAYPDGCLGCVRLIWRQGLAGDRTVWLWCHPGTQKEILEALEKAAQGEVRVDLLDGQMDRFRLVGPLSQPVLRDALVMFSGEAPNWLNTDLLTRQQKQWASLQSNPDVMPGHIFGLTLDSRPGQPISKRKKSLPAEANQKLEAPESLDSQLWETELRQRLAQGEGNCAPVLLVHRPAPDGRFGQGWDVIAPRKHGLQLWLRMVLCGARVGALRELQMLGWSGLDKSGVCFYPDTSLGEAEERDAAKREEEKFNKLPPAKRVGWAWFRPPWQVLLDDWVADGHDARFFIQRDRTQLEPLRTHFESPSVGVLLQPRGLVAVLVTLDAGGCLERCAAVCLPAGPDDLIKPPQEDKPHLALQRSPQTEQDDFQVAALFSRRVAGFVAEGDYCFRRGCHSGVAFVVASAFNALVATSSWNENLQVLIKSRYCPLYRKASVKIV